MRTRNVALVCIAISSVTACEEDDPDLGPFVCETIGTQGGTVASEDGVLTLAFRPGSLDASTQVCVRQADPPPDGPPAAFGTAYRVQPDIELGVAVNVTYNAALPQDPSLAVVLRQDFELGQGRWRTIPANRVEPENQLISATDTRLSMFYGLLDTAGTDTD